MTSRILRTPSVSTDRDGRQVLLVPLAGTNKHARIFPEDFRTLLDQGFGGNWCLNRGTVKVSDWRHNAPRVARLLMGLGPGDPYQARHRDGDALNLRRDNLLAMPFKCRKPLP
jgi:hypothetical protein